MINHTLNESAKKVIRLSEKLAEEYAQPDYSPEHMLWAVVDEDVGLREFLKKVSVDPLAMRSWAMNLIAKMPKQARHVPIPKPNAGAKKVLEEAQKLCERYGHSEVKALDLLEALITPDVGFEASEIRRLPLALYEVVEFRSAHSEAEPDALSNGQVKKSSGESVADAASHRAILDKYCENLNEWAEAGRIDPVLGRDRELKQLVEILGKRISPNVMVVGEPGVGKTSVVTGLVLKIKEGEVPESLKSAVIYSLDVSGQLIAGAFKGEVEERMKSILKAVKAQDAKAILFIDEIHILLDPKGPVSSGVVNLLKPELSRGEITLIGATTSDEYQKYIEKDSAFNRRFSRLTIEEPDDIIASQMLMGLVPKYEDFHQIKISKDAIRTAVSMAKKYIKDKQLPASAIELMDFSMACANQMNATSAEVLVRLEKEYEEDSAPDPAAYRTKIRNRLSELLIGRIEGESDDQADISEMINTLKNWTAEKKTEIDDVDITSITAYKSGIPAGNLRSKEQEKLQNAEAILKERVVGQDHVIEAVARGIKAFRTNLKEPKDPGAIFFFTGSTGTGKTELAKAIAQLLFDDEDALMRFDMSEFQESHSVATLLGAPPGYAGYDEGGILVNNVRKKPYSVVLFDEIEKAHQDIYGIFLQMLTDGRLADKKGKLADFSNAIIIFTSNAGAHEIVDRFEKGMHPTPEELKVILRETGHFKDEFLGRVDSQIIPFKPISEEVASLIFDIHMNKFKKLMKTQHDVDLTISAEVKEHILGIGFSPVYGARPIKNAIRSFLTPAMADKIIMGEVTKGSNVHLDLNDQGELSWAISETQTVLDGNT
jgi:ATP-dependent Clp protease ATP-binding subunit ClpA